MVNAFLLCSLVKCLFPGLDLATYLDCLRKIQFSRYMVWNVRLGVVMKGNRTEASGIQYARFEVDSIQDNSVTDFDLYLSVDSHLILYAGKGYKWYRQELTDLLRQGYSFFHVEPKESKKADMYRRVSEIPSVDADLEPKKRIQVIENIGARFTECLYEGELTAACVSKAKTIAESVEACVSEDISCVKELSGLAQKDSYTYFHSIRVATYAVAIAIELGISKDVHLQEIALGGILHDVGKKDVGLEIINKRGALTDSEWEKMKQHPALGHQSLKDTPLNLVPQEIILHHHEKIDGSGYPHGIGKSELLAEVQIACLADIFDALTSVRSYQQKRNRYEALDFIKHRLVGSKIDPQIFKALVSCFK